MHFKYDQHLELHNGIHAAIRGKLLEATFAPVWVEPLECSVMGSGFGEPGSTTAQTFALSGISSSSANMKRPKVLMKLGDQTLQMSELFNAYCRLHDGCLAFCNAPWTGVAKKLDANQSYKENDFHRDVSARESILSMWPDFFKLRKDLSMLRKRKFPASTDTKLSDSEKELSLKLESMNTSLKRLFLIENGRMTVDLFAPIYLTSTLIQGSLGQRMEGLMYKCLKRAAAVSSNAVTDQRFFLDNEVFEGKNVDMERWKRGVDMAASIVSAMCFAQKNTDVPGRVIVFEDTRNNFLRTNELLENLLEQLPGQLQANDSGETDAKMAVWAMPFLTLNMHIGSLFVSDPLVFSFANGIVDLATLHMQVLENFCKTGNVPDKTAYITGGHHFLAYVDSAIENSRRCAQTLDINYRTVSGDALRVGSFLGGMFANCAILSSHRQPMFDASNHFTFFVDRDPLDNTNTRHNCTIRSRVNILAASNFMTVAGILLGTLVSGSEMQKDDFMGRMVVSLYLVYLSLVLHMSTQSNDSMNGFNRDERFAALNQMTASNPDIRLICTTAWQASDILATTSGSDGARTNAVIAHYHARGLAGGTIDVGGTTHMGYMHRKLSALTSHTAANNPGFTMRSIILTEIYRVLNGPRACENQVYLVILQAMEQVDAQLYRENASGEIIPGGGTNTYAAISGEAQESLGADRNSSNEADTIPIQPILLGSILLDQSEQHMQQESAKAASSVESESDTAAAALTAVPEEGEEDGNNRSRSPTSTQEISAAQGGSGKKKSVGFKRVQAKLL